MAESTDREGRFWGPGSLPQAREHPRPDIGDAGCQTQRGPSSYGPTPALCLKKSLRGSGTLKCLGNSTLRVNILFFPVTKASFSSLTCTEHDWLPLHYVLITSTLLEVQYCPIKVCGANTGPSNFRPSLRTPSFQADNAARSISLQAEASGWLLVAPSISIRVLSPAGVWGGEEL